MHTMLVRATGEPEHILSDHLLESALARPQNLAAYSSPSIHDLAASYAEGIARNHAFENGNKRTAFAAAGAFLEKNGLRLEPERDNEHTFAVEMLSQGVLTRDEFSAHLKAHSREISVEPEKTPEPGLLSAKDMADQIMGVGREPSRTKPHEPTPETEIKNDPAPTIGPDFSSGMELRRKRPPDEDT